MSESMLPEERTDDPYTCTGCDVTLWCASMEHTLEDCESDCRYWAEDPNDQSAWCCMACPRDECNGGKDCDLCACQEAETEAEGGGMDPRQALKVVTEYVNDASSFAETFEPDGFGDPDRPIATGEGLGEALQSLADFLAEEPIADILAEPEAEEQRFAVRVIRVSEMNVALPAQDRQHAKRIVEADLSIREAEADDPELSDIADWEYPTPMDELAVWVDDVRELPDGA